MSAPSPSAKRSLVVRQWPVGRARCCISNGGSRQSPCSLWLPCLTCRSCHLASPRSSKHARNTLSSLPLQASKQARNTLSSLPLQASKHATPLAPCHHPQLLYACMRVCLGLASRFRCTRLGLAPCILHALDLVARMRGSGMRAGNRGPSLTSNTRLPYTVALPGPKCSALCGPYSQSCSRA